MRRKDLRRQKQRSMRVAQLISLLVVRDLNFAASQGGNNRRHSLGDDALAQGIAVITLIDQDGPTLGLLQEAFGLGDLVNLTCRQQKAQRSAQNIGEQVNLGRQPSSGAPQSLILGPPFPAMAA